MTANIDIGQIILSLGMDSDGDETYTVQQTGDMSTLTQLGLLEYAKQAITGALDHTEYTTDEDEQDEP